MRKQQHKVDSIEQQDVPKTSAIANFSSGVRRGLGGGYTRSVSLPVTVPVGEGTLKLSVCVVVVEGMVNVFSDVAVAIGNSIVCDVVFVTTGKVIL